MPLAQRSTHMPAQPTLTFAICSFRRYAEASRPRSQDHDKEDHTDTCARYPANWWLTEHTNTRPSKHITTD